LPRLRPRLRRRPPGQVREYLPKTLLELHEGRLAPQPPAGRDDGKTDHPAGAAARAPPLDQERRVQLHAVEYHAAPVTGVRAGQQDVAHVAWEAVAGLPGIRPAHAILQQGHVEWPGLAGRG